MTTKARFPVHCNGHKRRTATVVVAVILVIVMMVGAFTMTRMPSVAAPVAQTEVTFTASDRLLVVSPHPDDESIACSGLIRHALAAGGSVTVLWMTAGDHNVIGPPLFWKKAAVTPAQFREIGHRRMQEARTAAAVLGLQPQNLVFLGYPDAGLSSIFMRTWSSQPYRSGVTNTSSVPYAESVVAGQPQTARNLLADVEHVIASFRPTVIAYPNSVDNHPDHQATCLFVTAALADLQIDPRRLEYVVHADGWPRPFRFDPFADLYAPPAVHILGLHEEIIRLAPGEIDVKTRAIRAHASELLPLATLFVFVRRTEIFFVPSDLSTSSDPERTARFLFPVNRTSEDDRTVIRSVTVSRDGSRTSLAVETNRPLNRLEDMKLFFFPLPGKGSFSRAPKLYVVYRGGNTTADVTDLGSPDTEEGSLPAISSDIGVTFVFDDRLTGGAPRGLFVRLEKGPGRIDTIRSRMIWIAVTSDP